MSRSINRAELIGHLGAKPELRHTDGGTAVVTVSVATNRQWKQGEEVKEEVDWHRVVCWGRLAELVANLCDKGSRVYVSGRMRTRSYESQGVTRYATEIVCSGRDAQLVFLDGKANGHASVPPPTDADVPPEPGEEIPF